MRPVIWLALAALALVGCNGGAEKPAQTAEQAPQPPPSAPAPAPAPAPEKPAQTQPVRQDAQGEQAIRVDTAPPADAAPFEVTGTRQLAVDLSAPFELAGVELHLSFDGTRFKAGSAATDAQLAQHMCFDNPHGPGQFKYICAQVQNLKPVSGRLLTIPISYLGEPPTMADITVDKMMVVDVESQAAPAGVELKLSFVD